LHLLSATAKGDHRSPLAVFALPLTMRPTLFDFHSQVFQEGRHNIIALGVLGRASLKTSLTDGNMVCEYKG